MNLLATLRPPTRDEASRAYRDRIAPAPPALARLLGQAAASAANETSEGGGGEAMVSVVLPSAAPGQDVTVEISSDAVRVLTRHPFVQEGTGGDAVGGAELDVAVQALQALQLATGWYVFGPLDDGFEPEGECSECSVERFAWQDEDDACPACGEGRDGGEPRADTALAMATLARAGVVNADEARAEALVTALLENEWVELVSSSSRKALVRAVTDFLARHPDCRKPAGAAPAEPVTPPSVPAPAPLRPSSRALAAMSPRARAEAMADRSAAAPAAVAARAARDALAAAAPRGNPGFDLLDYLTDLPYIAEVYADEDALAALLRGSAAPEA